MQFYYSFTTYKDMFHSQYNDICLEAIFYDAYKGNDVSIREIFEYYFTYESTLSQTIKEPLKNYIYDRINKMINGNITANQLLNPNGGKSLKTLHPNSERSSLLLRYQDIKSLYQKTNKESFSLAKCNSTNKVQYKSFEATLALYKLRKDHLLKIESLFEKLYYPEKQKYIDRKHELDERGKILNELITINIID